MLLVFPTGRRLQGMSPSSWFCLLWIFQWSTWRNIFTSATAVLARTTQSCCSSALILTETASSLQPSNFCFFACGRFLRIRSDPPHRPLRLFCLGLPIFSIAAALLPFDRMARALVRGRENSVRSVPAPREDSAAACSASRFCKSPEGDKEAAESEAAETAAAALAFVLEGELDAARDLSRRRRLLLSHSDVTPESVFALLDDRGLGIVSKGEGSPFCFSGNPQRLRTEAFSSSARALF